MKKRNPVAKALKVNKPKRIENKVEKKLEKIHKKEIDENR
jgi:hypothetical protein